LLGTDGLRTVLVWFGTVQATADDEREKRLERLAHREWRRLKDANVTGPADMCDLGTKILPPELAREYRVLEYIGSGSYGLIIRVAHKVKGGKETAEIMKIASPDPHAAADQALREAKTQARFAAENLAPRVFATRELMFQAPSGPVPLTMITMEEMAADLDTAWACAQSEAEVLSLCDGVADLLAALRALRATHGDMHAGNIMMRDWASRKLLLVDFARSRIGHFYPEVDHAQLMRSCVDNDFVLRFDKVEGELVASRMMARILRGSPMRRRLWNFDKRKLKSLLFDEYIRDYEGKPRRI
jgi:serine/threonine protein kinase